MIARLIETRTIIPRHRGIDAKFSKQALANHSEEVIKLIKLIHLMNYLSIYEYISVTSELYIRRLGEVFRVA